jgi:hypothetical protein
VSSSSEFRLIASPADIQHIVLAAIDAPTPLFVPGYDVDQAHFLVCGNLDYKHTESHGDPSEERWSPLLAILHLSSTCSFYRKLLAPRIFEHVVLCSRPRSLMSCNTIRAADDWQLVSSLTVCGTSVTEERNRDYPSVRRYIGPLENFDFDCLSSVLSNLHPNLSKLVLDFPTEWVRESNKSGEYLSIFDVIETSEQILKLKRTQKLVELDLCRV